MLKIRLARVGKRGHATFRVVVTEHTRPPKSGSLAVLGSYDPHTNRLQLKTDRVRFYLDHGAQVSSTLHNLLVDQGILQGTKRRTQHAPITKTSPEHSSEETPAAPSGDSSSAPA